MTLSTDSTVSRSERKSNLSNALREIILTELTPRQRQVFLAYHAQKLNVTQIAKQLGVHKSTVSRTLRRAEARIGRFTKYL